MPVPNNSQNISKLPSLSEQLSPELVQYHFGSFCLNEQERQLIHNGKPIKLKAKELDVLRVLVKNNSRLVTKSQLLDEVWPNSFVSEANLSVHIGSLRKILRSDAATDCRIQTVNGFGYRFLGEVRLLGLTNVNQQVLASHDPRQVTAKQAENRLNERDSRPIDITEAHFSFPNGLQIETHIGPLRTEVLIALPAAAQPNPWPEDLEVKHLTLKSDLPLISSIQRNGVHYIKVVY